MRGWPNRSTRSNWSASSTHFPTRAACAQEVCQAPILADYHDLFGQIDAAVVATPTRFHHRVSLDLLEHGIHLLIEKPLATTVAEADEVLAAARRNGAMVQVGHIERFNPAWNQAEVTPLLRCPKYIDATRTSGYTFRSTDIGVVLDMMIHDLDLVLHFANSPVRNVQALGISVLGDHEDVAQARLEFANGCVANLSASRVSYQPVRQMQVWSEHGCVTVDFSHPHCNRGPAGHGTAAARVRLGRRESRIAGALERSSVRRPVADGTPRGNATEMLCWKNCAISPAVSPNIANHW